MEVPALKNRGLDFPPQPSTHQSRATPLKPVAEHVTTAALAPASKLGGPGWPQRWWPEVWGGGMDWVTTTPAWCSRSGEAALPGGRWLSALPWEKGEESCVVV